MREQWEEKLTQVLETTHPPTEPEAGWERQAVAAMGRTRPAGRPRRWVALAAVAAVVVAGLGFVPFPAGSARGALDRALAAMEDATTVHMKLGYNVNEHHSTWEVWWSSAGFLRLQRTLEGGLSRSVTIEDEGRQLVLSEDHQGPGREWQYGRDFDRGPGLATNLLARWDRAWVRGWHARLTKETGWHLREYRTESLWGGARDVVETEGVVKDGLEGFETMYDPGDRVRLRLEADPMTGRLQKYEEFIWREEAWKPVVWTEELAWDEPIPQQAREFTFPKRTTVRERRWWGARTKQEIGRAQAGDWEITLYALEADLNGDLYATLACEGKRGRALQEQPTLRISARDGTGARYLQQASNTENRYRGEFNYKPERLDSSIGMIVDGYYPRSYWAVELARQPAEAGTPRRATVTVEVVGEDVKERYTVEFPDLPVPPRQAGLRLLQEAETIRHY